MEFISGYQEALAVSLRGCLLGEHQEKLVWGKLKAKERLGVVNRETLLCCSIPDVWRATGVHK